MTTQGDTHDALRFALIQVSLADEGCPGAVADQHMEGFDPMVSPDPATLWVIATNTMNPRQCRPGALFDPAFEKMCSR